MQASNANLIASGLTRIEGNRVIAANGESAEADVIIFGTGFDLMPPPVGKVIQDANGEYIAERWKREGAQAYLGTTMHSMPNAFMMVGPNILVYSSFIEIAEWQSNYVADAIRQAEQRGVETITLTKAFSDEYNEYIQTLLTDTVFNSGGCDSYYLGEDGRNLASWPWTVPELQRRLSRFDLVNYQVQVKSAEDAGKLAVAG